MGLRLFRVSASYRVGFLPAVCSVDTTSVVPGLSSVVVYGGVWLSVMWPRVGGLDPKPQTPNPQLKPSKTCGARLLSVTNLERKSHSQIYAMRVAGFRVQGLGLRADG